MDKATFLREVHPHLNKEKDGYVNVLYKEKPDYKKTDDVYVYFDMDGTLAKWYKDGRGLSYPEQILDPRNHYYRDLEPNDYVVELAKECVAMGLNVCVLSSADIYCVEDKILWLNKYCPFIKDENILFCPIGANKSDYARNASRSVLIDDYHVNLDEWVGTAVKLVTDCNTRDTKRIFIDIYDTTVDIEENLRLIERIVKQKEREKLFDKEM